MCPDKVHRCPALTSCGRVGCTPSHNESVLCGDVACMYLDGCCGENSCCRLGTRCNLEGHCVQWPAHHDSYCVEDSLTVLLHASESGCSTLNHQLDLPVGKVTHVTLNGDAGITCWTGFVKVITSVRPLHCSHSHSRKRDSIAITNTNYTTTTTITTTTRALRLPAPRPGCQEM